MEKLVGACVAILMLVGIATFFNIKPSFHPTTPTPIVMMIAPTPVQPSQVRVVDVQAVVKSIRSQSKLQTTEVEGVSTITIERAGHLFGLINSEQVRLVAVGSTTAGVDLSKLTARDIRVSEQSVEITVPAPEIFNTGLDEDRSFVAEHDLSWFSKADPALADSARRRAVKRIEQIACVNGLVDRTERDVQTSVEHLVRSFGFASVTVVVPPSTMCDR